MTTEQVKPKLNAILIADMRSERPYRPVWPEEEAREYIKEQNGKHFDPKVVLSFLELQMDKKGEV
ncbi:MAG: hypothetical protein V2B13_08155 [Pseudomonadota bacterium]